MKKVISTIEGGPRAAGPYSLGVIAEGKFLHVSGQIPFNPETGKVERGTIEEQTQLVLNNLRKIIETAGARMEDAVSCRVYLQPFNPETFRAMNSVYEKFWGNQPPVRTTLGVQLLNCDVEIDCVVVVK